MVAAQNQGAKLKIVGGFYAPVHYMTCLNQKKEGVEELFPKVVGKTHYEKL